MMGGTDMNLIEKARQYSQTAHKGQTRRLSSEPYFIHPEAVAKILSNAGLAPEVVAAGYLHDTVEDTEVTISEIKENFGEKVATIVAGNTEDKTKSWEERKEHTIQELIITSFEIKCLIAADKLDNLKSIMAASEASSEDIWQHFKRGKEQQGWYYKAIANALFENLDDEVIPSYFFTYRKQVNEFFE
jgi:(p)ppGpp synthase/HD superfamily hydrolase